MERTFVQKGEYTGLFPSTYHKPRITECFTAFRTKDSLCDNKQSIQTL